VLSPLLCVSEIRSRGKLQINFDKIPVVSREKLELDIQGLTVPFLGRNHLIQNKRASGRKKDVLDADHLENNSSN